MSRRRSKMVVCWRICVCLLAVGILGIDPGFRNLPDYPYVSTIAGSGAFGNVDGPALSAEFMEPVGVAYARDGSLYILDRAAQRLKVLKSGRVTTVAGSGAPSAPWAAVPGGYADGPGPAARFNQPAAIAVGRDGAVYIADTQNHCIRRFFGGIVSTFAGSPHHWGHDDGNRTSATFSTPMSLAFDSGGDLFVADFPVVRRIDTQGNVSTIAFRDSIVSVAIIPSNPERLLVSSPYALQLTDLTGKTVIVDLDATLFGGWEGRELAGPASQVVALDQYSWVYTDPWNKSVRFVSMAENTGPVYTRAIGQIPSQSAANRGGGFKDGTDALFNEPLGLSVDAQKNIAVADTGNRRIRLIPKFDTITEHVIKATHSQLPAVPERHAFRIALVGDSLVWTNLAFRESIGGVIERELTSASLRTCGLVPRVYPIKFSGASAAAGFQYIANVLSSGVVDYVVYLYPSQSGEMDPEVIADLSPDEVEKIVTQARAAKAALASDGIQWIVVT